MPPQTSGQSEYTMGYSEEFLQLLHRRSLEKDAAYLFPYLKPGLKVLDFGCGPGTMSVGLASAVQPGEVHGIDIEESQIAMARAAAEAGGHSNATFQIGDVTDLPFEDGYFDIAHCHAVLMHVPDTAAALAEVKRVLKPGGVIGGRELITASCFVEPDLANTAEAWNVFGNLLAANGGHPQMGKRLKNALVEAGFTNPVATASIEAYSDPNDIAFIGKVISDWFFTPQVMGAAIQFGLATQEQFDAWQKAIDQTRDHPGAFVGLAFGECIATKPVTPNPDK